MSLAKPISSLAILIATVFSAHAQAKVSPASLFTDNMVVQRQMTVPVWGTADAGEKITVTFNDQSASAVADSTGKWRADLKPTQAGGPFTMTIAGENTITLKNVLVGDVWIGSGQSNMAMSVIRCKNAKEELAQANYPNIRLFTVARKASFEPVHTVKGAWTVCTPRSTAGFSAAAYFFARDLHNHLNVPIGVINSSWGGTNAETWTPRSGYNDLPQLKTTLKRHDAMGADFPAVVAQYHKNLAQWAEKTGRKDPGNTGFDKGYAKPDFDDSAWSEFAAPGYWERKPPRKPHDGVAWFRKTIDIPEKWAGKPLTLRLARIDDYDITYFNGEQVGATDASTPNARQAYRTYNVPAKLARAGKAVVAVRIFDDYRYGGFAGHARYMTLHRPGDKTKPVSLAGDWRFTFGAKLTPTKDTSRKPTLPRQPGLVNTPMALYNGMIYPLVPYAIKGVIWYQGEANAGRANAKFYRKLFPAMITSWRNEWDQGDFPFLFVQLANYRAKRPQPANSAWAMLRESQLKTLALPNTGITVIIDVGEARDIHPKDKQTVGKRLALAARAKAYGETLDYSGPIYKAMTVEDNRIVLTFDHVGDGLIVKGDALTGFAIAGKDKNFVWAHAEIQGNTVVVSSDKVKNPVAVRYAWADNPDCTLYNKADLPASPFRTDDW